jgi:hypothetical protein
MREREREQLLAVANHYLRQARELLERHRRIGAMTIGEVTRGHRRRSLTPAEVVLAHLGSAAVRLATLCEIDRYRLSENYRDKFYKSSGTRKADWSLSKIKATIRAKPAQHLYLLLRDNVAHEEPGNANARQLATDRAAVLKETTIDTCSTALRELAHRLKC